MKSFIFAALFVVVMCLGCSDTKPTKKQCGCNVCDCLNCQCESGDCKCPMCIGRPLNADCPDKSGKKCSECHSKPKSACTQCPKEK